MCFPVQVLTQSRSQLCLQ